MHSDVNSILVAMRGYRKRREAEVGKAPSKTRHISAKAAPAPGESKAKAMTPELFDAMFGGAKPRASGVTVIRANIRR